MWEQDKNISDVEVLKEVLKEGNLDVESIMEIVLSQDCKDKLIKNYGIGAQIIKSLKIKNMILVTRSRKKVVGLDGYGIKIVKQEIIK